MKQIFQNLKTGEVTLPEIPLPQVGPRNVLIQGRYSLISLGTEKMLLDFGKSSWVGKALSHPEKVEQVISKIKTDGILPTVAAVKNKLDRPLPLGYSHVGVVIAVGNQVKNMRVGDRVVSNGPHAEVVNVTENLCARIPDNVSDQEASFTIISSIGLQGIRLLSPNLGETVVVIGLGLIGQLSVQLLLANGVRVIGFDLDPRKVEQAKAAGAEAIVVGENNPIEMVMNLTHNLGADGVLITASTKNSGPSHWAPQMCRQRGKVVLVGVVDLDFRREDFYEKEINFQVSCSYGPGRYDSTYEEKNIDYPYGLVRWTENRNFQTILSLLSQKKLDVKTLIDKEIEFEKAAEVYQTLGENQSTLGIILRYSQDIQKIQTISLSHPPRLEGKIRIGFIGAGNFASAKLLPILQKNTEVDLVTIASAHGSNSFFQGNKYGFRQCSSDWKSVIADPQINTIFIATPHHLHAPMVIQALQAGKHVFVEKPLCINLHELKEIEEILEKDHQGVELCVGFNRRYSSLVLKMKELIKPLAAPLSMIITINAGSVDADHWIQDGERGGGRLVGEGCHFIDLARYLVGHPVKQVHSFFSSASEKRDTFTLQMIFNDGSLATIHYFSNGNRDFPKERVEVFSAGKVIVLDNFRNLKGFGFKNFSKMKVMTMDKGHEQLISKFFLSLQRKSERPMTKEEILESSKWSLIANESKHFDVKT